MEMEADAKDFITMMKEKLEGRNLDNIDNTDLTLILYWYHANKILNVKGSRQSTQTQEHQQSTQSMSSLPVGQCYFHR